MQIILGESGFCRGVQRAISLAEEQASSGKKIFTLHDIIHNKNVVSNLASKGILPFSGEISTLSEKDCVLISAHGCQAETEQQLLRQGVTVVDATCPFVANIHSKVKNCARKGDFILIVGDEKHIEVQGIRTRCDRYAIINSADEIDFDASNSFLVVVQTTYPYKRYLEIKKNIQILAEKLSKTVEFFDSICYTTRERQREAKSISAQSNVCLVVGDKSSSNCNKLLKEAQTFCSDVYFIENVSDLNSVHINNKKGKLGILSGASTPKELTMEVFSRMSEQNVIDNVKVDEVMEETTVETKEEVGEGKEITSMEEAMKKFPTRNYREGMRLKARVVKADMNGITVAVEGCGKNDCGFIAKEEAELDGSYDPANYNEGDTISAVIIPKESSKDKAINLSKKAYDAIKADDEHVKKILAGEEFTLSCNQEIKGGLLGKIGTYTVFVPASQVRIGFVKTLADYVNKPLRLKALPPKEELDEEGNVKKSRNPKRIVASQRVILEEEKAGKDDEFWSKIYEGAIVNGKVKRFTTFGAFVSLKHMDALVHNSDLSWSKKRINDPGEVLELNKAYDFIVLATDRENGKISLGYKQLQKKPSEIAQEKYPVGTIVKGKVARIVKFGAFVELEPGIDGLVHISQINHGWIQNANEALKEGDEVEVKVMNYDDEKITLSIKELIPATEQVEVTMEYTESSSSKPVNRTAAFNRRLEGQEKGDRREKRPRRMREDADDEPREYVTRSSGVTLGDLFNFNKIED